jgi:hypothetical protein
VTLGKKDRDDFDKEVSSVRLANIFYGEWNFNTAANLYIYGCAYDGVDMGAFSLNGGRRLIDRGYCRSVSIESLYAQSFKLFPIKAKQLSGLFPRPPHLLECSVGRIGGRFRGICGLLGNYPLPDTNTDGAERGKDKCSREPGKPFVSFDLRTSEFMLFIFASLSGCLFFVFRGIKNNRTPFSMEGVMPLSCS